MNWCQSKNNFRHLITIQDLATHDIRAILDLAKENITISRNNIKVKNNLKGRTQINLFFEPSTRTRSSFEIAGKRLQADVININVNNSSIKKGETLLDMAQNLAAMQPDIIVVRHQAAGAAALLASHLNASIINAGDGAHEHPTQALLDALTIEQYKGPIAGLKVAICGDILHSRVARSNILCLSKLGAQIRLVGPKNLMPSFAHNMAPEVFYNLKEGLEDVDVIMMLRVQKERMINALFPSEQEYLEFFGLNQKSINYAKKDCVILHPGPINRGIEISSIIADSKRSLIMHQVEMGVAIRMAALELVLK